jgi:serine phosphatase RsbU (regulator of sigma subunit)
LPSGNFLQSTAFYLPVAGVGGDYYDLFALKDGVYAAIVADVSGHGLSAALVMAAMKILLKSNASPDLSPSKTLQKINEMLVNHVLLSYCHNKRQHITTVCNNILESMWVDSFLI